MPPAPFMQPGRVIERHDAAADRARVARRRRDPAALLNAFGGAPLPLTSAAVALPAGGKAGVSATQAGSSRRVTFGERCSTRSSRSARSWCPIPSTWTRRRAPTLPSPSIWPRARCPERHLPPRLADHLVSAGTATRPTRGDLLGRHARRPLVLPQRPRGARDSSTGAVAVVGDSLTDGRGSTTNGNDRSPDQFFSGCNARIPMWRSSTRPRAATES